MFYPNHTTLVKKGMCFMWAGGRLQKKGGEKKGACSRLLPRAHLEDPEDRERGPSVYSHTSYPSPVSSVWYAPHAPQHVRKQKGRRVGLL